MDREKGAPRTNHAVAGVKVGGNEVGVPEVVAQPRQRSALTALEGQHALRAQRSSHMGRLSSTQGNEFTAAGPHLP